MKMNNYDETHEGLKGLLNSVDHPILHRLLLKLSRLPIIEVFFLRRFLVRGKKKPVRKDQGVDCIFIDPPYCKPLGSTSKATSLNCTHHIEDFESEINKEQKNRQVSLRFKKEAFS